MAIWQRRSKRKPSGGKYHKDRTKRARELGSDPIYTTIGENLIRIKRSRGGNRVIKLLKAQYANVAVAPGKIKKVRIESVQENTANRHFTRMNVITRGAIIKTELGLAKVTSRPSRQGVVNAVLIK